MTEPLPPNDVPTSPGPGFVYDGGTVAYTRNPSHTTAQPGDFSSPPPDDIGVDNWYASYSYTGVETIRLPAAGGTGVRRVKLAENNSPIPRDRYFLDYRFFRDVIAGIGDVNRYTFGTERTWCNGLSSIEARVPIAATLDSIATFTRGKRGDVYVALSNGHGFPCHSGVRHSGLLTAAADPTVCECLSAKWPRRRQNPPEPQRRRNQLRATVAWRPS